MHMHHTPYDERRVASATHVIKYRNMAQDRFSSRAMHARLRQGDYKPKPKEQLTAERDQRESIRSLFAVRRDVLEKAWKRAQGERKRTFTLKTQSDLTRNGLISREDVASTIRQWTFETYNGRLGLERFDDAQREVCFRFAEEPEAINEDPDIII